MRIGRRQLATTLGLVGLIFAAVTMPSRATAQCSMMGGSGGGHDHGATQDPGPKQSKAEKKQRESIARLLSDEQGRRVLSEALLEDRAFIQDLVARILAAPEWKAYLSQELARPASARTAPGSAGDQSAASYVCPMHPEVTSPRPGSCPKCGMALVEARGK